MKNTEIKLTSKQIKFLRKYKKTEHRSLREFNRVNILLLLHKGKKEADIADFLDIERTTIWRTKQKYLENGVKEALQEKKRSGQPVKYKDNQKAEIIATACSKAPEGRARWTLQLLTNALKKQGGLSSINRESIRLILKKTNVSLG
jgi:transposase